MNEQTYKALQVQQATYRELFPDAEQGSPCLRGELDLKTDCSMCTAVNYGLDCCNNPVK